MGSLHTYTHAEKDAIFVLEKKHFKDSNWEKQINIPELWQGVNDSKEFLNGNLKTDQNILRFFFSILLNSMWN